jgi:hypothetical protein
MGQTAPAENRKPGAGRRDRSVSNVSTAADGLLRKLWQLAKVALFTFSCRCRYFGNGRGIGHNWHGSLGGDGVFSLTNVRG